MSGVEKVKSSLLNDVREIISAARTQAVRSVDSCRVQMYWHIGRRIFEEEQLGKDRADYGTYLIKNLAKQLEPEYGSGFSVRQLEMCRQFYRLYPITNALRSQLNWTQYRLLIQMYVNYYDRVEKTAEENPTIGILLCTDKNDTVVRMALPEDNRTILASEYKLYLPTQTQLIDEVNSVLKSYNAENR